MLLGLIRGTGAFSLAYRAFSGRLLVINYHRILDDRESNPFDNGVISCDRQTFLAQIDYLGKVRQYVSVEDVIADIEGRRSLPKRPTLLTFDDAYVEHASFVAPALSSMSVPACFFVPTAKIANQSLGWWDHIAYGIKKCEQGRYRLMISGSEEVRFNIVTAEDRMLSIQMLQREFKNGEFDAYHFYESVNVAAPSNICERAQLMTVEQLQSVAASRFMTIGSHSVSHRSLSRLSLDEMCSELTESKEYLEEIIDKTVMSVAYPIGGYDDVSDQVFEVASKIGYKVGFTFFGSVFLQRVSESNRYAIDRIALPPDCGNEFFARTVGFPTHM